MNKVRQFFIQPTLYFGLGNVALGFGIGLGAGNLFSIPVLTALIIGVAAFLNCYGALLKNKKNKLHGFLMNASCMSQYLQVVSICFAVNCITSSMQWLHAAGQIALPVPVLNMTGGGLNGDLALALTVFNAAMFFGHFLFARKIKRSKRTMRAKQYKMPYIVLSDISYVMRQVRDDGKRFLANDITGAAMDVHNPLFSWMVLKTVPVKNISAPRRSQTIL